MPNFPIIDTHVHLYHPSEIKFDWMAGVPKLNAPHLPETYKRLTAGVEIEKMVFVEVDAAEGWHIKEAQWVQALSATELRLKGMVASLPMEKGVAAVAGDLAVLSRLGLARGVRRLIQGHVDEPGWCLREPFVEAVQSLAKHGLSFDLCIYHPQMKDVTELVRRCPDVRFVLDHIGKPGIKAGLREPWESEIKALSRHANVWCKISGVVTEADHAAWKESEVLPYVRHAISCFGYDRVMFGGDWPVSELATSYQRWVAVVDEAVKGAAIAEWRKIYRETAERFYKV